MTILTLIMLVLASLTEQTRKVWKQTSQRIDSFGEARTAFEAITRNLSQATLNTYWDYDSTTAPRRYVRRSELRFISGNSLITTGTHPTHSVFFQAPLGYASAGYEGLESLLNTCGYYVELADDQFTRPAFLGNLTTPVPTRTRFRLMQLSEPSDKMTLYKGTNGAPGYKANDWFNLPLDPNQQLTSGTFSHTVAENVIALVLLPKDPPSPTITGTALSTSYTYTSAPDKWPPADPQPKTENQLPPLLQVTMVAIDEISASRLHSMDATTVDEILNLNDPDTGTRIFTTPGNLTDTSKPGYAKDLNLLEKKLQALHLSYRIFSSEVSIRGAKWSKEQ